MAAGLRGLVLTLGATLLAQAALAEEVSLTASGADVSVSRVTGQIEITITLNPSSREAFAIFTGASVGRMVTLRVRGVVVAQAKLMEPIAGGVVTLSGLTDKARIEEAAHAISGGNIPLVFSTDP